MPTTPRLQREDLIIRRPEMQYRSCQEHSPRAFTPSAITTTSFTDAAVDASLVGRYIWFVDGDAKGQFAQVKSVAATVATWDRTLSSVANTTQVRAFQPADVPWVTSAVGSTTTLVCASHANVAAEPDGFWVGYLALCIGGPNAGKSSRVTGFVSGGATPGQLTIADAVTSTVAGELWVLCQLVRPEAAVNLSIGHGSIVRQAVGFAAGAPPVITLATGSCSWEMAQKAMEASSGGGAATAAKGPIDLGDMLRDVFTETLDTGSTVAAGGSTSVVKATAGAGFSPGGFLLTAAGEAAQIMSKSGNDLTVGAGQLTVVPAAGSNLYASAWYKRMESGHRTSTIEAFRGGLFRQLLHGCMPTVGMNIDRANYPRWPFSYTAAEALQYNLPRPIAKSSTLPIQHRDTSVPYDGKMARFLIGGTSVYLIKAATDFKFEPKLRDGHLGGMNQSDGCWMELGQPTVTLTVMADNDDRASFEDIPDRLGDIVPLFYQKGTLPGKTFVWSAPAAQLVGSPFSYNDGQGVYELTLNLCKPQLTEGSTFDPAIAEITVGWL